MTTSATRTEIMPSATPTEAELAAWTALSREAQVSRYREALTHPDCSIVTDESMGDILAAARERVATRDHG
jgi:hypothetical protein